MPVTLNKNQIIFPPVEVADETGLVAIGGNLSEETLLSAYRQGIFPWNIEDGNIMWYSPDPRLILLPDDLIISKSMKQLLNRNAFDFSVNKDFEGVIRNCAERKREGEPGSWISPEMIEAYTRLHKSGYGFSAEAWMNGELAGGLYGLKIGNVFFGESMFTNITNAGKYAFIRFVRQLKKENIALIDCQVYTSHLASLGARLISRDEYIRFLNHDFHD